MNGVSLVVKDGVEEANQDVLAVFEAKDFLEGKVGFGVDEDSGHGDRGEPMALILTKGLIVLD